MITTSALYKNVLAATFIATVLFSSAAADGEAGAFLDIPTDARGVALGGALGGAMSAHTASAMSWYWNPAGVAMVSGPSFGAAYADLYGGLGSHQALGITGPVGKSLFAGLGVVRLGVDNIPALPSLIDGRLVDRQQQAQSSGLGGEFFSHRETAVILTFAKRFSSLFDAGWQYLEMPVVMPVGLTVKYITISSADSLIDDGQSSSVRKAKATGIGVDIGMQLHFGLNRLVDVDYLGDISLSLVGRDLLNTPVSWDTPSKNTDHIPRRLIAGWSYTQPLPSFGSVIMVTSDWDSRYRKTGVGVEYRYGQTIALRAGNNGMSEFGVSLGAGFKWGPVALDYAYQHHALGVLHRISLGISL